MPPAPHPAPIPPPDPARPWHLVADVGGTHVRFALCAAGSTQPQHPHTLRTADHPSLTHAIAHYLRGCGVQPRQAAIAIANPVTGDCVHMTNHSWAFSAAQLRAELGLERLHILNDFSALALALPTLKPHEYQLLLPPEGPASEATPDYTLPMALIGPGTGLGVSGLLPVRPTGYCVQAEPSPAPAFGAALQHTVLAGEGGHVSLPVNSALQARIVRALQQRWGHASAERVLCGPGLSLLHGLLREFDGGPAADSASLPPAEVSARGLPGPQQDPHCAQALALFAQWLGSVAGNLALTLGARGGVWIGGGIPPRLGLAWWRSSGFAHAFSAKGRFQSYLRAIPVWLIHTDDPPALRGAARALLTLA